MVADFAALNDAARDAERQARAAALDSTRSWIDPNGHKLSSRVWRARQSTRTLIDQTLRQAIASGTDALVVADTLEQYLKPEYRPVRRADGTLAPDQPRRVVTYTPYGRSTSGVVGGRKSHKGSFPARRLARTEISRAHAQATQFAAARNPFVTGMRWVRANNKNEPDECDGFASHDEGLGRGVYPVSKFPRMPAHPMCRCHAASVTRSDTDNVVSELRATYGLDQDWTAGLSASDRLAFHVRADVMRRGIVELFESFFRAAGVTA